MVYHWSMITFGVLYTVILLGCLMTRYAFDKPIPRPVSGGLIGVLLLLGAIRFCCCKLGTQDCPMTIGGMKTTSALIIAAIGLVTLLSFDVPMARL